MQQQWRLETKYSSCTVRSSENICSSSGGSRLSIVVVQLGAVKIYVAAVEALRKKKRQDETQFTTKIDGFLSFTPLEC